MSKELAINDVVFQAMPQFTRIARKRQLVRWEEESQYALQACKSNPALLECDPGTIQDAIINVAAVGLSLNPASGYAYLVPDYSKPLSKKVCQLRVSYRGLIKLATDTGAISWVKAEVVKEKDTFEFHGINQMPLHHMNPFADRGETIGAYCVAKTNGGELLVDTISRLELDHIQASAKTPKVWVQWPDEMRKKAIIKRAAKQWPKNKETEQLNDAIQVINDYEGNDFEEFAKLEEIAATILKHIENDDIWGVGETWCECSDEQQSKLWTAITKGGWFTQDNKVTIRKAAQEYKQAIHNAETLEADKEQEKL